MELFKLLGKIVIDNTEANNEIDETTSKAAKSGEGMSGTFKKVGAAVATYFTVDAIKNFGSGCINAAADANAASSQFTQVFGDFETNASKSLKNIADESGVSENRMKGSFTKIASFAKTTGMDTESALGLSERAMIAVADSAAFYDRSLEDTTESLQSFLKGNFENDAALGLSCTETTRNAAANALYGKSFKDLSESQKQLTLLQMVEDANKASGALGQAARESDTWSNQTGNLKQAWTDFQAILGANVLPTAVDFVKKLAEIVADLAAKVPAVVAWFQQYGGVLANLAVVIGTVVAGVGLYNTVAAVQAAMQAAEVTTLGALIAAKLAAAAATVAMYAPYIAIAAAIAAVIAIGVSLVKNWDTIKQKCSEMAGKVKEKWSEIKSKTSEAWSNVKAKTAETWANVKSKVVEGASAAMSKVSSAWSSVKSATSSAFSTVRSFVSSTWSNIKSSISNAVSGAFSAVSSKFSAIKTKISSVMESAKSIVTGAVSKLKSAFNFNWSLPKLKLPHISVSGGKAPFGIAGKGSLPSFSIQWYKKAYDEAMLLNNPTIFGYSSLSGNFLGGGDGNGSEVVAGSATLMKMIETAVARQNEGLAVALYKILDAILALDGNMGGNLREALAGTTFEVNKREFARLVKAVN